MSQQKVWIVLIPSQDSLFPGVLTLVTSDDDEQRGNQNTTPIEPIKTQRFLEALNHPRWTPFADLAENWLPYNVCPCCRHPFPCVYYKTKKIAKKKSVPCTQCHVDLKEWIIYYHQHHG